MSHMNARAEWEKLEEALKAKGKEYLAKEASSERMQLYLLSHESKLRQTFFQEYREEQEKLVETLRKASEQIKAHPEFLLPLIKQAIGLYLHFPSVIAHDFGITEEQIQAIAQAYEKDAIADEEASKHENDLALMPYKQYLQTPEWKMRREQALRDAGNKCQLCYTPKFLEVHHKTYQRRGHELPGDLIVLCNDCHSKHHDKIGKENTRNFR